MVVDPRERNQAVRERWHLPFAIHADLGGVEFLQPLDNWNPDERGGIGWPTTLLFNPRGEEVPSPGA